MIRITLTGQPGNLTGTIEINDATWRIADWRQGGDPGHVNARTSDGEQITLALGDRKADGTRDGAITVNRAPWDLRDCRFDGLAMTGTAIEPAADEGLMKLFPGVFAE